MVAKVVFGLSLLNAGLAILTAILFPDSPFRAAWDFAVSNFPEVMSIPSYWILLVSSCTLAATAISCRIARRGFRDRGNTTIIALGSLVAFSFLAWVIAVQTNLLRGAAIAAELLLAIATLGWLVSHLDAPPSTSESLSGGKPAARFVLRRLRAARAGGGALSPAHPDSGAVSIATDPRGRLSRTSDR